MRIKDATENDLPAIVDISNTTIPGRMVTADTEPVTVGSRLLWFKEHKAGFRPLWVADDGDRIVAWLSFQSFYGRPAYHGTAEVSVYVAADRRHEGIGGELLKRAIEYGPDIGVKTLIGFIFAHNVPSLRLFEKFGFEKWGYLPKVAELDGIERDLVIVGRRV